MAAVEARQAQPPLAVLAPHLYGVAVVAAVTVPALAGRHRLAGQAARQARRQGRLERSPEAAADRPLAHPARVAMAASSSPCSRHKDET